MKYLLLSLLLGISINTVHQYHLSQCLIAWNRTSASYEVSQFLFIDDLKRALEQQGATAIHIQKNDIDSLTSTYIQRYLSLHFEMKAGSEPLPITYIGEEVSDDLKGLWCYFEIPVSENETDLNLRNDLLMEVFSDQKNVITVKGKNNKEHYFLLKKGDAVVNF